MNSKLSFRILFLVVCVALLCAVGTGALSENSNDISSGGYFAYHDGYMYFVSDDWMGAALNDGRETGLPDSVEFWRIADAPGAQKELIASLPAAYVGGYVLSPGMYLTVTDNAVYFVRDWPDDSSHKIHDELMCLDIATVTAKKVENTRAVVEDHNTYAFLPYLVDGDLLYFKNESKENMVLDMQSGTATPLDTPWVESQTIPSYTYYFEPGTYYTIQDGYIYYPEVYPYAPDQCGISRMPVSGGDREIVVPRLSDYQNASFCFVQGQMLYLFCYDTAYCVDIATGTLADQFPMDYKTTICNGYGGTLNVADGKLYYLKEDGLYVKSVGLQDETRLISGNMEGIECLTLGENYFYFHDSSRRRLLRVSASARFMEEAELLLDQAPYRDEDQYQNENGWLYDEYENCVTIKDYMGEETVAEAPAEINGKPVVSVGLDPYGYKERPLRELIVPEGVLRLDVIGGNNLASVSLPSSLLVMSNGGYPYVFAGTEAFTVQYAGTMDEWQAVEDRSWNDGSTYKFCDNTVSVFCAEGQWTPPESTGTSY